MLEPSLNLYNPFANLTGRTNFPSLFNKTSSSFASLIPISSASTKAKYFEAKSPGSWLTGNFWVKPAPSESVLATIIPSLTPNSRNAYLMAFNFAIKSSCGTVTFPSWWPHCFASETWFSIWIAQAPASIIFFVNK